MVTMAYDPTQNAETATIYGRTCTRTVYDGKWSHWRADDKVVPQVFCCECKQSNFQLVYGEYEIRAKCCNCGYEDEVYSG